MKPCVTREGIPKFDNNHLSSISDGKGHSGLVKKDEILVIDQILELATRFFST